MDWIIGDYIEEHMAGRLILDADRKTAIALVFTRGETLERDEPEDMTTAHLVKAAPGLLEACRAARMILGDCAPNTGRLGKRLAIVELALDAAIAKAEPDHDGPGSP